MDFISVGFTALMFAGLTGFFIKKLLINIKNGRRKGNYKKLRKARREAKKNESNN